MLHDYYLIEIEEEIITLVNDVQLILKMIYFLFFLNNFSFLTCLSSLRVFPNHLATKC